MKKDAPDSSDIPVVNASTYLDEEPPEPDQILKNLFDTGDKLAVIASSKQRKSMFVCQLALALSSGKGSIFGWDIPKIRRVLLVQLEVKGDHFHRRVRRLSKALGISSNDLQDRLQIINGRGLSLHGQDGIEKISRVAELHNPEVLIIDPFYKLNMGVENAQQDMQGILAAFDKLVEDTGAGLVYVHHDGKGSVGEKQLTDRGSGSGVMGRDYDTAIILSKHSDVENATVLETVVRNYAPQTPCVLMWECSESGDAYCFQTDGTIAPEKQASRTKIKPPPLSAYLPAAQRVLENLELDISIFKQSFKELTGVPDSRVKDFVSWATAGNDPYLIARSERGRGVNKKWLRFSENHTTTLGNVNIDLSRY